MSGKSQASREHAPRPEEKEGNSEDNGRSSRFSDDRARGAVISTEERGRVMIRAARLGAPKRMLERRTRT
jgi:hypothetical protein